MHVIRSSISSRRTFLAGTVASLAVALSGRDVFAQPKPSLRVYKDPSCGCCQAWVEYMEKRGYKATVSNGEMEPIKARFKVPGNLQSCHTTIVAGYVIEGHVPASDLERLLTKKPKGVLGLTVPGMPASAPGMDQMPFQPYTVFTFDAGGRTTVFTRHDTAKSV